MAQKNQNDKKSQKIRMTQTKRYFKTLLVAHNRSME